MKEFRIFYIVLIIISLTMSLVYQSRLMPIILIILVACPLISLALLLINYIALEIKMTPEEYIVEKYEDKIIVISLKNRFIFPISPVRLIGDFQGMGEKGITEKMLLADISPLSTITLNLPFSMPYRGEYTACLERAEIFDIFKLFRMKKKLCKKTRIVVLPREIILEDVNDANETENDGVRTVSIQNKNTFSNLKEYTAGDSLKHIHWKMSAKQDNLVVKQMEQSVNNSSIIFCDLCAEYFTENSVLEDAMRTTDAVLESALALTRRIILDNNNVKLYWQNGNNEEITVSDYTGYKELFYAFSMLPALQKNSSLTSLIELHGNEINTENIVYIITPDLNKELLSVLEERGLIFKSDVILVLLDFIKYESELIEYIKTQTKIDIRVFDNEQLIIKNGLII